MYSSNTSLYFFPQHTPSTHPDSPVLSSESTYIHTHTWAAPTHSNTTICSGSPTCSLFQTHCTCNKCSSSCRLLTMTEVTRVVPTPVLVPGRIRCVIFAGQFSVRLLYAALFHALCCFLSRAVSFLLCLRTDPRCLYSVGGQKDPAGVGVRGDGLAW